MSAMMDMMVQQAILSDDMHERHGIEEEEFNQAIKYYDLLNDPEVSSKIKESMEKLQTIGSGMGGGMDMM
jgi:hypothetical protein